MLKEIVDTPGKDWGHCNSVFYVPEEDAAILSFYHQDAVVKLDMDSGEIQWILGTPSGWKEPWQKYLLKPKGDLQWQYHQHAAKMTPNGTLILFDNGTYRASPPDEKMKTEDAYSRAVEYRINEETMEVEEVWSYGGPNGERFFSPFICDVDWLPRTGNILVTDGGRIREKDSEKVSSAIMGGHHWARIAEVTHTTPRRRYSRSSSTTNGRTAGPSTARSGFRSYSGVSSFGGKGIPLGYIHSPISSPATAEESVQVRRWAGRNGEREEIRLRQSARLSGPPLRLTDHTRNGSSCWPGCRSEFHGPM